MRSVLRRNGLFLGISCLLSALAAPVTAGEIRVDLRFDFPGVGHCTDGNNGCVPWDGSLAAFAREGHPVMPVRVVKVLLPAGEILADVQVVTGPVRGGAYRPRIATYQLPLTPGAVVERDLPAWDGGDWPAVWNGDPLTREFRGYRIVEIPVYPMRVTGPDEVSYLESATVKVGTRALLTEKSEEVRPVVRDLYDAYDRVDNAPPDEIRIVPQDEEIGYLIIGPRELIGTEADTPLAPVIADKETRNMQVTMAALEDVSPSKDPKAIRDYIRLSHKRLSVDFVLLVGDRQRLPWKYVKSGVSDRSDPVPSDQYYACLDGDFESPQTIDWACEVSVGRIGARSRAEVAAWAAKHARLRQEAKAGKNRRFLNFGEKLDGRTLGDRVLNFLISGTDRAPKSVGFGQGIEVTKLYETFSQPVSGDTFTRTLNQGDFHVINHLGHANETYVFRMQASGLAALKSRPAFFYSQGCYPNDPDTDNWTIQAVRMPDAGPAAMIANTRYGWYAPGDSDEGTSSVLHRTFWSMRFGAGVRQVGTMNHRAKETVIGVDRSALMIYTALESNLIGDPDLDLGL